METKLLKKGDRLLKILDADVSESSFDEVMEMLVDAPDDVALEVVRNVVVKRKKVEVPIPYLTIVGGNSGEVVEGTILRNAIQTSGSELYRGMDKMTNCGGVGQCKACAVEVLEGADNLSPRTATEEKILARKGPSFRLACQAFVSGDVKVEVPTK